MRTGRPLAHTCHEIAFRDIPKSAPIRATSLKYHALYLRIATLRRGRALQVTFLHKETAKQVTTALRSHAEHDVQRLGNAKSENGLTYYYWLELTL